MLLAAFSLLMVQGAHARGDGPLQLEWHAPPGCPTATQVLARIRKLVASDAPPLTAEASITRRPGGRLQLRLVVRASELVGERELEGQTCEDVTNAAVIHLALLLQGSDARSSPPPSAATRADADSSTPPASANAPTDRAGAADSSGPAPSPERASAASTVHFTLQPLALLALGELPRPALGLGIAAGARIARWQLLLDARVWRAQRSPLDDSAPGVDLQRAALGARVCRALISGEVELSPCLRVSVQQLWARGTGPHVAPRTARQSWGAAALGLQGRLQLLGGLGLVVQLEAQLATAQPRLELAGEGELERLDLVSVHSSLGLEWIL